MRTTGNLHCNGEVTDFPEDELWLQDESAGIVANILCHTTKETTNANAQHLVACWNATESAGGSPAIVGELVAALERALSIRFPNTRWTREESDRSWSEWECETRALLARVRNGGAA